jgi:hypothetical protein
MRVTHLGTILSTTSEMPVRDFVMTVDEKCACLAGLSGSALKVRRLIRKVGLLSLVVFTVFSTFGHAGFSQTVVGTFGKWQVLEDKNSAGGSICTIYGGGNNKAFTVKVGPEVPSSVVIGILKPLSQSWGKSPGSLVPITTYFDDDDPVPTQLLVSPMPNAIVGKVPIGVIANWASNSAGNFHIDFPLNGGNMTMSLYGFARAFGELRRCIVRNRLEVSGG